MIFRGTWSNQTNNELIRITGPNGSDEYFLEYDFDGHDFKSKEEIPIYISSKDHALLANSTKFGRSDIRIIDKDSFSIKEELFIRSEN